MIDFKCVYIQFTFAIGSQFIRNALDDFVSITDFQRNMKRIQYCQMWGNTGTKANEKTSQVRLYKGLNTLEDSEPIADFQGKKKRIPYCQMWGNTGATANEQTSEHGLVRKWESCRTMPSVGGFSRGSPVSCSPSFRRRSIFTSITRVGSKDLAVKSHPNICSHSTAFAHTPKTGQASRESLLPLHEGAGFLRSVATAAENGWVRAAPHVHIAHLKNVSRAARASSVTWFPYLYRRAFGRALTYTASPTFLPLKLRQHYFLILNLQMAATGLENREMSGNLQTVRELKEMPGNIKQGYALEGQLQLAPASTHSFRHRQKAVTRGRYSFSLYHSVTYDLHVRSGDTLSDSQSQYGVQDSAISGRQPANGYVPIKGTATQFSFCILTWSVASGCSPAEVQAPMRSFLANVYESLWPAAVGAALRTSDFERFSMKTAVATERIIRSEKFRCQFVRKKRLHHVKLFLSYCKRVLTSKRLFSHYPLSLFGVTDLRVGCTVGEVEVEQICSALLTLSLTPQGPRWFSGQTTHLGEPGSGIVPDDAAGRRVFSGISSLPHPFVPALLRSHLISPSSTLKTSLLRAAQISQQQPEKFALFYITLNFTVMHPLVHTVFDISRRMLTQVSSSTGIPGNQCAVNIGITVHKTVESSLQVIELASPGHSAVGATACRRNRLALDTEQASTQKPSGSFEVGCLVARGDQLVHPVPVIHTSYRTLAQSSPFAVTEDNECAVDIGIFVHMKSLTC
ncbi:hypothetical protein PR048_012074, partial [Dryococelus australis]